MERFNPASYNNCSLILERHQKRLQKAWNRRGAASEIWALKMTWPRTKRKLNGESDIFRVVRSCCKDDVEDRWSTEGRIRSN